MTVTNFGCLVYSIMPRPTTISAVYVASVDKYFSLKGLTRLKNENLLLIVDIIFQHLCYQYLHPRTDSITSVPSHMILADYFKQVKNPSANIFPPSFSCVGDITGWKVFKTQQVMILRSKFQQWHLSKMQQLCPSTLLEAPTPRELTRFGPYR